MSGTSRQDIARGKGLRSSVYKVTENDLPEDEKHVHTLVLPTARRMCAIICFFSGAFAVGFGVGFAAGYANMG